MNIEEDDFVRPVLLVGDRLGYVHIGENHRGYLGIRAPRLRAVLPAPWTPSATPGRSRSRASRSAVVDGGLSNDLAVWRNLWTDGVDLARHAHHFITEQLYLNRVAA